MNIYDAALRHLGSRARTCREMEQYLKKKGFQDEEIEVTINELKDCRYLDDGQYCSDYFRYAEGKGKGIRRIRQELREKGVSSDVISLAWEDYEPETSEKERARKQAEKIMAGKAEADEKLLARMGRRLSGLGYSTDVIYQILGEYRNMREKHE